MPDPRILDYLRQNQGQYPVEALKQALLKNGFPSNEVEESISILTGQAPPPAPTADGEPSAGERIRYSPGALFSNGVKMIQAPEAFFLNLDPEMGIGPGVVNVLLWAALAGVVSAALFMLGFGPAPAATVPRIAAAVVSIVLVPVLALVFSFIGSGIYHVICKILGGKGSFSGSYNALAGIIALAPISSALRIVPYGEILPQLYGLYLVVQAAWGVHRVPKVRAWIVFGLLTAIGIAGNIAMNKARELLMPGGLPRTAGPGIPGGMALPQTPEQAMANAQSMQQAMAQSQQMLQDMNRYQTMAEPPADTLALLDAQGQERLSKAWPTMSGPIRQSIVQGLPQTLPGQRNQSIEQVLQATQGVDQILNQSMQMLQQIMPPEGQEQTQGKGR
ncbi:MAG: Yip1 family protein [Elusimicrobiota bacterium]